MVKKVYHGRLVEHDTMEAYDILYLEEKENDDENEPLASILMDDMNEFGRYLTVRYFISTEEKTIDELTLDLIKKISGQGVIDCGDRYSEATGYLWTDEEIIIGGHDLLNELTTHIGMFCHLEIEYHKEVGDIK